MVGYLGLNSIKASQKNAISSAKVPPKHANDQVNSALTIPISSSQVKRGANHSECCSANENVKNLEPATDEVGSEVQPPRNHNTLAVRLDKNLTKTHENSAVTIPGTSVQEKRLAKSLKQRIITARSVENVELEVLHTSLLVNLQEYQEGYAKPACENRSGTTNHSVPCEDDAQCSPLVIAQEYQEGTRCHIEEIGSENLSCIFTKPTADLTNSTEQSGDIDETNVLPSQSVGHEVSSISPEI
jgi:hypothetical protein